MWQVPLLLFSMIFFRLLPFFRHASVAICGGRGGRGFVGVPPASGGLEARTGRK
jgi:hypothetical protein